MDLIKIKTQIRKTRPRFMRSGAVHIKRVSRTGYRKPKGLHNKMGLGNRGHRAKISSGYAYPKALRGSNRDGLKIVTVYNESELQNYDPKEHAIIVAASVGMKKKLPLFKACLEHKFAVQNSTQIEAHIKRLEENAATNKNVSKAKKTTRKEAQAAALKAVAGKEVKKEAKAAKKSAASTDEKKAADKKEQDKVLAGKKQ